MNTACLLAEVSRLLRAGDDTVCKYSRAWGLSQKTKDLSHLQLLSTGKSWGCRGKPEHPSLAVGRMKR